MEKIKQLKSKGYEILRWSEKYTKTDMVYLTKGGFWVSFGQMTSSVLSLLLVIAFANLLPKETYGLYKYILSIAGLMNIFTLTGMNNAVARNVARGNDGALRTSVRYQLKWNILMFLAFIIIGGYYFSNNDINLAISLWILGVFVPLILAFNTYGSYLEGKRQFSLASISSIISTTIYVVGILLTLLISKEVVWIIAAYAVTTFTSTILFYLITLYKFKPPLKDEGDTLKYGRELTFIGLIGPIASQIDKVILAHFWGSAQLAIYSLAMAVPERATSLLKNWVGIGFPKFSTKTQGEINSVFYKRIFQGMFLGVIASVGYIILAPFLFKYILPQYIDSILYSQILAISLIFAIPNRYISLLLVSQKLSKRIFINSLIQSSTRILLYIVMGVWGGIMGLIVANVSMSFIGLLVQIKIWRSLD
jgi:O-antigen/teichoic acid export membrane protein